MEHMGTKPIVQSDVPLSRVPLEILLDKIVQFPSRDHRAGAIRRHAISLMLVIKSADHGWDTSSAPGCCMIHTSSE